MAGCARCGSDLPPLRAPGRPRQWCSETCRVRAYEERNPKPAPAPTSRVWFRLCAECGLQFCARSGRTRLCGPGCVTARASRKYREAYALDPQRERERLSRRRLTMTDEERARNRARNQLRRAALYGAETEEFSPLEIYDRDRWICGLCFNPIDRALRFPDPWSATLDHIVPLSHGGPHTRVNVRAAHLHCNSSRGNRSSTSLPDTGTSRSRQGR